MRPRRRRHHDDDAALAVPLARLQPDELLPPLRYAIAATNAPAFAPVLPTRRPGSRESSGCGCGYQLSAAAHTEPVQDQGIRA